VVQAAQNGPGGQVFSFQRQQLAVAATLPTFPGRDAHSVTTLMGKASIGLDAGCEVPLAVVRRLRGWDLRIEKGPDRDWYESVPKEAQRPAHRVHGIGRGLGLESP